MVKQKFFSIFEQFVFKEVPGRLVLFLSSRLAGLVSPFSLSSEYVAQNFLWAEVPLSLGPGSGPVLCVSHSRDGSGKL